MNWMIAPRRRLARGLLCSAALAIGAVAIGLTPGVRHSHSIEDPSGQASETAFATGQEHSHGGRVHTHSHGRTHRHSHRHSHGSGHSHSHPHTQADSKAVAADNTAPQLHTHFTLFGFEFTIFDRTPVAHRRPAAEKSQPLAVKTSRIRQPQHPERSVTDPREGRQASRIPVEARAVEVVEWRATWTSEATDLAIPRIVTTTGAELIAASPPARLDWLTTGDDSASSWSDTPPQPPPEIPRFPAELS